MQSINQSKSSVKTFTRLSSAMCFALSLGAVSSVYAANKDYSFTFTGTDGSSGTVVFTIDDSIATTGGLMGVFSCGSAVALKNLTLTLTGGTVPSGTQSWNCSHVTQFICRGNPGATVPCGVSFNFGVNNGTASMMGTSPNVQDLSWIPGAADESSFGPIVVAAVHAPIDLNFNKPVEVFATEVKLK
jgi:hypothetical protein